MNPISKVTGVVGAFPQPFTDHVRDAMRCDEPDGPRKARKVTTKENGRHPRYATAASCLFRGKVGKAHPTAVYQAQPCNHLPTSPVTKNSRSLMYCARVC